MFGSHLSSYRRAIKLPNSLDRHVTSFTRRANSLGIFYRDPRVHALEGPVPSIKTMAQPKTEYHVDSNPIDLGGGFSF